MMTWFILPAQTVLNITVFVKQDIIRLFDNNLAIIRRDDKMYFLLEVFYTLGVFICDHRQCVQSTMIFSRIVNKCYVLF